MRVNVYKVITILSLATIMVVYNNCGSPFGKPSPLFFESNVYGGSASVSYDAFEKTVYPITRTNCVSCHSSQQPEHASSDVRKAHDAVVSSFKVNFENIRSSRMVKKLRDDNHNCWGDCNDNADEMEEAITEWKALIKNSGSSTDDPVVDTKVYLAPSKTLSEEFAVSGNGTRLNVVNLNIDAAMLNPPMIKTIPVNDDAYLSVPTVSNTILANNSAAAGTASFNFMIRQASAQYRIWGLVDAPTVNDNAFYTSLTSTNTGVKEWEIPVTVGWEWRQLPNNVFTLGVGNHSLQIRERKDGTKIKKVVITSDANFSGLTAADLTAITLTYDLSEILRVPGITFKVDVSDYDLYSYKFQNPRIVTTSVNVKARNVRLLVNNSYNPQHSTFTLINKVATPADGKLLDYAMLVIKDKGFTGDKISFSFDELKLDNGGNDPALAASEASFLANVYPISRNNCIGCHTTQQPPHAHDDYTQAHDVVVTQSLANFVTPANSRLVTKTRGRHNCGTQAQCDAIANQFQAAIIEWKKSRP
ncbi:MAG: hypothetical protein H0V66_10735 [Bdellovibrionales bacterium]|nr:hypothetical protein [Bdellovibrionales bacterium]